ncbi:MAG: hypothetical protein IT379_09605 [Deltaproteobacteria bacterium]|nr:hypothetical protein [Deltaproteobacteria bacterium]
MSRWSTSSKKGGSYFMEMLAHRYNLYGLLGAVGAGAALSIPFGLGLAFVPLLGYLATTSIAALFVPGSASFRRKVDERRRKEARDGVRNHLLTEIRKRVGNEHGLWGVYHRMLERRDALARLAQQSESAIQPEEVEQLDDSTIDFLGLWLGRIAIGERDKAFSEQELKGRIHDLERDLKTLEDAADRKRLLKAKTDLEGLVKRRQEMRSRDRAAEAAMMSMSDAFDELYQRVMANPTSRDAVAGELRSAVERLNVEEELDTVLFDEVEAMLKEPPQAVRVEERR